MKHKADKAGKSVRLLRVGEEIRHMLASLLARGDVHDDVIASHSITVTEVRVSPDLRHATVFVEPLGGADEAEVLEALKRHARFIKGEIGRQLRTKYTPDLAFRLDDSFANATRIDSLLRSPRISRDLDDEA
jgi:ribosome-binding factor A